MLPTDKKIAYTLTRKKSCKHIILKVKNQTVHVSSPHYTAIQVIEQFVESKRRWISQQLLQQQAKVTEQLEKLLLFGAKYHVVVACDLTRKRTTIVVNEESKQIFIKTASQLSQADIRQVLKNFLKKEAEQYFTQCFTELMAQPHIASIIKKYLKSWRQRYLKTAFGLCYAQKGEVVLNTELVCYDKRLVKYVILHELSHFFEQNHSSKFYQVFEALEPNYKEYKKLLNQYHQQYGGWSR